MTDIELVEKTLEDAGYSIGVITEIANGIVMVFSIENTNGGLFTAILNPDKDIVNVMSIKEMLSV